MFRICFCCCLLLLTTSCVSNGAQNAPNFPKGENPIARMQPDTERLSARVSTPTHVAEAAAPAEPDSAAHILSELEAAVAAYDVHTALTLFAALYEASAGGTKGTLFAEAQEKIRPLLARISIEAVNQPPAGIAGIPFSQPFAVRVAVTLPEMQVPLVDYPLCVAYPSAQNSRAMTTARVTTDADGYAAFTPPLSEQAIDGTLSYCLFPEHMMQAAAALPENVRTVFPYKVATAEKSVPTIIAILDYDEHNQPVFSANVTATRLLTGMLKQGFSRIGLDEYAELAEADESLLRHAVQAKIGDAVKRVIFGKTAISVQDTDADSVTCTITAELAAWDFKEAGNPHRFTFEYTAEGATKEQAIARARMTLGESIIADALTYRL